MKIKVNVECISVYLKLKSLDKTQIQEFLPSRERIYERISQVGFISTSASTGLELILGQWFMFKPWRFWTKSSKKENLLSETKGKPESEMLRKWGFVALAKVSILESVIPLLKTLITLIIQQHFKISTNVATIKRLQPSTSRNFRDPPLSLILVETYMSVILKHTPKFTDTVLATQFWIRGMSPLSVILQSPFRSLWHSPPTTSIVVVPTP